MLDPRRFDWLDQLIMTRDVKVAGERTELYARVRGGELVAVRVGVYMLADQWRALDSDEQYRARVRATIAHDKRDPIASHVSAAAMWQLPWFLDYPRSVHVLGEYANGGRSTSATIRHNVGLPARIEWIDGIRVTNLARTVVDIARTAPFAQAVAVSDAALRRTQHPLAGFARTSLTVLELLDECAVLSISQGTAKARKVIDFADAAAELPGESISRVNISAAGLPAPQLQEPMTGASGRLWHVDFWWPAFNLIGEFDGKSKYTDEKYLRGRTPQQALYEEKLREDDLRAAHHGFTRWPWSTAISVPRLRAHLIQAGLR